MAIYYMPRLSLLLNLENIPLNIEKPEPKHLSSSYMGELNAFYGKSHTFDSKQKISSARKGKGLRIKQSEEWINKRKQCGDKNPMYGKSPWNKGKVGIQPARLESKIKKSNPVVFRGETYWSIGEAARIYNTTEYYIKKEIRGIQTPTRNRPATSK